MSVKITAEQLREECSVYGTDATARALIAQKYGLKESTVKKYIQKNGLKSTVEKISDESETSAGNGIEAKESLRPVSWESMETGFSYSITNGMLNIANMKGKVRGMLVIYPSELELLMLDLFNLNKYISSFQVTAAEDLETAKYVPVHETTDAEKLTVQASSDIQSETLPEPEKENKTKNIFVTGKKVAVFYRCPECGKVEFALTDNPDVKCHRCGHLFKLSGIQSARVSCPNCGEHYITRVADEVNCVPCRSCRSPVDLVWNERKKIFDTMAQK